MVCISLQSYQGENEDYCSHLFLIFEVIIKFPIVFVRLILGKVGLNRFTGARQIIHGRHEFGFKVIFKGFIGKIEITVAIFD